MRPFLVDYLTYVDQLYGGMTKPPLHRHKNIGCLFFLRQRQGDFSKEHPIRLYAGIADDGAAGVSIKIIELFITQIGYPYRNKTVALR